MKTIQRKKKKLFKLDSVQHDIIQHNGHWVMVCEISSVDMDMMTELYKTVTMDVFRQFINSLDAPCQVIYKKNTMDTEERIDQLRSNVNIYPFKSIKDYGHRYVEYVEELTQDKMQARNLLAIRTNRKCDYQSGKDYLDAIFNQVQSNLETINLDVRRLCGDDLSQLYDVPETCREEVDYFTWGSKLRRTYIVQDYPSHGHPNWLRPLLDFSFPVELTQHYEPYDSNVALRSLELTIAKLQSTMNMQADNGGISNDLTVRLEDAEEIAKGIASGNEKIMNTSFYVTISASSVGELNRRSIEIESCLRQLHIKSRRSRKESHRALKAVLPLCHNQDLESYTFNSRSLATLIPFTKQNYFDKEGIIYGTNSTRTEIISVNRFGMPNPNMIVLGKTGFGKSMFTKVESARQIIDGTQVMIIDHNGEYKGFCEMLGGQYLHEHTTPDWDHFLLVFGGDKIHSLKKIWDHVQSNPLKKRGLVIDEFHIILKEHAELMLEIMKQIRHYYVAPTLVTQNIRDLLRSDAGKMIIDLCSTKTLFRQGENDLKDMKELFHFSDNEELFLASCGQGAGYLYTDTFKTRLNVTYSPEEGEILTTNPAEIVGRRKRNERQGHS